MTMTVSAKQADGTFSYEVRNGFDIIEAGNSYPTQQVATISAKVCYHELHRRNFVWDLPFVQNDYMSLEEIMAEL